MTGRRSLPRLLLASSVWVGDPARQTPMTQRFNSCPVYGGTFPALIFHDYMAAAMAGQPVADLPGLTAPTATSEPSR